MSTAIVIIVIIIIVLLVWWVYHRYYSDNKTIKNDVQSIKDDATKLAQDTRDKLDSYMSDSSPDSATMGRLNRKWNQVGRQLKSIGSSCASQEQLDAFYQNLQDLEDDIADMKESCASSVSGSQDGSNTFCRQDVNGETQCYETGGDGTSGWWRQVDADLCQNAPTCAQAMVRGSGFNPFPSSL